MLILPRHTTVTVTADNVHVSSIVKAIIYKNVFDLDQEKIILTSASCQQLNNSQSFDSQYCFQMILFDL